MQVKLLTSLSEARQTWSAGDTYECSSETAARLIEKGFASPIREEKIERAVKRSRKEKASG